MCNLIDYIATEPQKEVEWLERYFIIEMPLQNPLHDFELKEGYQYVIRYLLGDFKTNIIEVSKDEFIDLTNIK